MHEQCPDVPPLPALVAHHGEAIDFGSLFRTRAQRDQDCRRLQLLLAPVLTHRAVADRLAFGQQWPVDAGSGQPLCGGGPGGPLCQERI